MTSTLEGCDDGIRKLLITNKAHVKQRRYHEPYWTALNAGRRRSNIPGFVTLIKNDLSFKLNCNPKDQIIQS